MVVVEELEIKENLGAKEIDQSLVDLELVQMFRAGVHLGYSRTRRHPKMAEYMYGIKNNVEIFDLEKVRECLRLAEAFLKKLGEEGKQVLWVGTKPSVRKIVEEIAGELGASYVAWRWIGGTLTNAKVIRERIKYFEDLKKKRETRELEKYTKKEQLKISQEISKLEEKFSGIENLKNDLAALVIVDPREEKTALHEAVQMKLPVVAILSSDNDRTSISYPIPANDTIPSSVRYLLSRLAKAWKEGRDSTPLASTTNADG